MFALLHVIFSCTLTKLQLFWKSTDLNTLLAFQYLMVFKALSPGCGVEASLMLFSVVTKTYVGTYTLCIDGLSGKEIRSVMTEAVAQLYTDLDGGFSAEAWLLPAWLPLPSFK